MPVGIDERDHAGIADAGDHVSVRAERKRIGTAHVVSSGRRPPRHVENYHSTIEISGPETTVGSERKPIIIIAKKSAFLPFFAIEVPPSGVPVSVAVYGSFPVRCNEEG